MLGFDINGNVNPEICRLSATDINSGQTQLINFTDLAY
jgi:hypothetical protein